MADYRRDMPSRTLLATGIGTAATAVIGSIASAAKGYTAALRVNLVLNAGWSWLFFKAHKLGPSAVAAGALAVSSADLARRTAQVSPAAGLALAPYPLWCTFATVMSTDIWRLNR